MNIEEIDKWLDNEYGCSYTRLEELHDFVVEQDLKHREEADKEIQRLNNIIKEVREYINENAFHSKNQEEQELYDIALLEILDKGNVKAIPPEVIGTNGEDGGLFDYGDKGE